MCLFVIRYNQKREKSTHSKSRLAKSEIPLEFGFQFSDGKRERERERERVPGGGQNRNGEVGAEARQCRRWGRRQLRVEGSVGR